MNRKSPVGVAEGEELTPYEKALEERYGKGFVAMTKKMKAETKDYPCGCAYKGNDTWELCAEHQELVLDALKEGEP